MDIHSARQQLRQKSIYEIPLRVTFYAVSYTHLTLPTIA